MCGGDEYTGSFRGGKFFGKGRMTYQTIAGENKTKERAVYEGEWVSDMRSGQGTMKWMDGSVYEGEWRVDKRFYGRLKMSVGYTYEGGWENGLFHGKGKLVMKNGMQMECEFEQGRASVNGRVVYKDGAVYVGSLVLAER